MTPSRALHMHTMGTFALDMLIADAAATLRALDQHPPSWAATGGPLLRRPLRSAGKAAAVLAEHRRCFGLPVDDAELVCAEWAEAYPWAFT